ncbi:MAG: hypothetical protein Q9227_001108 [Pyrenula ochraceoflavens]
MKSFQTLILLAAAAIAGVSALPAPDDGSVTLSNGTHTWVGVNQTKTKGRDLEARGHCSDSVELFGACDPGACQCVGNSGCYSCNGGPYVCQVEYQMCFTD